MPDNVRELSRISSPQFKGQVKSGQVSKVLLPIGSLEQHGPHLPLSTDTIISEYVAERVNERCPDTSLLPAISLGCSPEHLGFAGTISLESETVSRMVLEVSASLRKSDIAKLFIINGHGGNRATLEVAIARTRHVIPEMQVYGFTIIDIVKEKFAQVRKSSKRLVGHADEVETSMMLAIRPEVVDLSRAISEEPRLPASLSFEPEDSAGVAFSWEARELSDSGVIGDPRHATAEKGRTLIDFAVEKISTAISQL